VKRSENPRVTRSIVIAVFNMESVKVRIIAAIHIIIVCTNANDDSIETVCIICITFHILV